MARAREEGEGGLCCARQCSRDDDSTRRTEGKQSKARSVPEGVVEQAIHCEVAAHGVVGARGSPGRALLAPPLQAGQGETRRAEQPRQRHQGGCGEGILDSRHPTQGLRALRHLTMTPIQDAWCTHATHIHHAGFKQEESTSSGCREGGSV